MAGSRLRRLSPPEIPDVWGERLVATGAALLVVALAAAWIQMSYLQGDFTALLSFGADDGWCLPKTEGLGIHCFADFHQFISPGPTDPFPMTSTLDFSPGASIFYSVFDWLGGVVGIKISLMFYLTLAALALVWPVADGVRRWPVRRAIPAVVICGLATFPFLTILDRGNTLAFAVPALYLYVKGLRTGRLPAVAVGVALATVMKPQFVILLVGLLVLRQFRQFFVSAGWTLLALVLAFAVFPDPVSRLATWGQALTSAQNILPPTSPHNISLAAGSIQILGQASALTSAAEIARNSLILRPQLLGGLCALLLLALLFWKARGVEALSTAFVLFGVPAFCLSSSNMYYSAVALPIAATVLAGALYENSGRATTRADLRAWSIIAFAAVALAPIAIAVPVTSPITQDARSWWLTIIPFVWLIASVVLLLASSRASEQPAPSDDAIREAHV